MADFSAPEIIIRDWIQGRADSGVVLAQAVTDVTTHGDHMTIHINQFDFARAKEWPVAVSVYPEGIADFYAIEFGWTNPQAEYLRNHITTLEVVDSDGRRIGRMLDTAEYQQRKNPPLI